MKKWFIFIIKICICIFIIAVLIAWGHSEGSCLSYDKSMAINQMYLTVVTTGITPTPVYLLRDGKYGIFSFKQTGKNFEMTIKMFLDLNKNIEIAPAECYQEEHRTMRAIPQYIGKKLVGYVIFFQPKKLQSN